MRAATIGGMRATIDSTIAHAKQREQFGKPVAHFQSMAHKIADTEINCQVCRNAGYQAAWLKQEGLDCQLEASATNAITGKLVVENALESIQIHDG